MTITQIDCQWATALAASVVGGGMGTEEDKALLRDMVQLYTATEVNYGTFLLLEGKIENFFCVELDYKVFPNTEVGNIKPRYQLLANTALALLHTSHAFYKLEKTSGPAVKRFSSLHDTACKIFAHGSQKLIIDRLNQDGANGTVAETQVPYIKLYNKSVPHIAQNIAHEIGHFLNYRLRGAIDQNPVVTTSPLQQLVTGELKDSNGSVISKVVGTVWSRGEGLGLIANEWQQNLGTGCGDNSCRANEEVADMFMNWAFDAASPVFVDSTSNANAGSARRNFMNTRLTVVDGWITKLINDSF